MDMNVNLNKVYYMLTRFLDPVHFFSHLQSFLVTASQIASLDG